ncbi:MAG: GNAT family N-acetyltransferase [Deltaproteobacteria bacterium]|nr:GNAT family N-acetyltransferase [Deltaproteobacteria bacterium]
MIRRLGLADLPALLELERLSQLVSWTEAALRDELTHVDGDVFGIGDPLVGHVCLRRILDELWILNLATHPQHRRMGIATRLIAVAKQQATSTSTSLWLEVREGNVAARALYEREGLAPVGRRPGYYPGLPPATEREAAILMMRKL